MLRCYLWQNLIYSAYLVNRGYANFPKTAWMWIICIPRLRIKEWKFCENIPYRQWSENCNNFRGLLVLDPEPKDMYHCHPYHFLEIYKPPVNEPIGSYQIQHLNMATPCHTTESVKCESLGATWVYYSEIISEIQRWSPKIISDLISESIFEFICENGFPSCRTNPGRVLP